MSASQGLESSTEKPKIKYLQIDQSGEYMIADKSFFPLDPEDFNKIISDFTLNPDNFLHYPKDSSYILENGKILFRDSEGEITSFNYIPICSVSGKIREINQKKVASLLWSWNNNSLGVTESPELKQKIENLKLLCNQDIKLKQYGLAFREHEFENPIDAAIYQATIYTAWFCKKLNGYKLFFNMSSGGEQIELQDREKEAYNMTHIIRPYIFIVLYK
jgi:hypothetical protein